MSSDGGISAPEDSDPESEGSLSIGALPVRRRFRGGGEVASSSSLSYLFLLAPCCEAFAPFHLRVFEKKKKKKTKLRPGAPPSQLLFPRDVIC